MSMVAKVFMAAGGAAAGYVIVGLAAALGKLIVGAVLRFRFDEFVFFMIRVGRRGKGLSVGLCDPQTYISCSMLDTKYTKMRNLIYGAFSMAAALFFTETVWFHIDVKHIAISLWLSRNLTFKYHSPHIRTAHPCH